MLKTLIKIYPAAFVPLIICCAIFFQCDKYHMLEPGPVSFHILETGNGNLNVSFSDTVVNARLEVHTEGNPRARLFFSGVVRRFYRNT